MNKQIQFLNDVVKPWDELNALLSKPFAYEPGLNDGTRMAGSLAITINHQWDFEKPIRDELNTVCPSTKVMWDIADMVKHHELRDKKRENRFSLVSAFERNGNKYKFLRTIIRVIYEDGREFDFAIEAINAINYWSVKNGLTLPRELKIMMGTDDFKDSPLLTYNPSKSIAMNSTEIQFFQKGKNGELVSYVLQNGDDIIFSFSNIT